VTKDEAEKILEKCDEYIDLETEAPNRVCLDGWFTAEEIEAVLVKLRADQP